VTVLQTESDGPWLYAHLPAGTYSVTAQQVGNAQMKHVTVTRSGQARLNFSWAS